MKQFRTSKNVPLYGVLLFVVVVVVLQVTTRFSHTAAINTSGPSHKTYIRKLVHRKANISYDSNIYPPTEPLPFFFGPRCPVAIDEPGTNFAYVLTPPDGNYFLGALVTAYTLRKVETVADIIICYREEDVSITPAMLEKAKSLNIILHPQAAPPRLQMVEAYKMSTMKIIGPWALESYDKVIYLDMDNIIYRNIDHLFYCPELTGVDHNEQLGLKSNFLCHSCDLSCKPSRPWATSAIMVIKPNADIIENILACTHPNISTAADMEYINCYFKCSFHKLPLYYQELDRGDWKPFSSNMYVAHWSCGRKPFHNDYKKMLRKEISVIHNPQCQLSELWFKLFFELGLDKLVQ